MRSEASRSLGLSCLSLLLLTVVYPPDTFSNESLNWETEYERLCDNSQVAPPEPNFPAALHEVHLQALEIRSLICSGRPNPPTEAVLLQYMADTLAMVDGLEPLLPVSTNISDTLPLRQQLEPQWTQLKLGHAPVVFVECFEDVCEAEFQSLEPIGFDQAGCNAKTAAMTTGLTCKQYLREFAAQYNFAQGSVSQLQAARTVLYLEQLEADWTSFFERSKSQTALELIINGALFQNEKIAYRYSPPPERQLVVLHPRAVISYVDAANDGSQSKAALMLEWAGIDYWQQDRWYIPTGASLVTVYTDRSGADDVGHGISVNFRSQFSVGITGLTGDTGFFLSLDLLKLLQDKASTLEAYRGIL